jgi:hypothetical protein
MDVELEVRLLEAVADEGYLVALQRGPMAWAVVATDWPDEAVARYGAEAMFLNDPAVMGMPEGARDWPKGNTPADALRRSIGMTHGVTITASSPTGTILGLLGRKSKDALTEKAAKSLIMVIRRIVERTGEIDPYGLELLRQYVFDYPNIQTMMKKLNLGRRKIDMELLKVQEALGASNIRETVYRAGQWGLLDKKD